MNKNEKKDNVIMLSDFQRNDDYLDDELSNFQKNDDSLDNKEKITAPFAGDSMERFEFLRENFTEVKEIIIKRYLKENNMPTKKLIIDFSFKDNKELFAPAMRYVKSNSFFKNINSYHNCQDRNSHKMQESLPLSS